MRRPVCAVPAMEVAIEASGLTMGRPVVVSSVPDGPEVEVRTTASMPSPAVSPAASSV